MKQLILAAVAVLSLGIGSAFAQSFAHEAPRTLTGRPRIIALSATFRPRILNEITFG